ncbi:MAG: DnaJ domain-containing protein [Paraprevotella sp.]|nr:DnaJ domain-containing protein [Paraprevotella sp.]
MAFIDYYKIMGIPKDTPQKDIKTAYKKRAKQFHPDLHPDDPKAKAKFQALNEAYDVLNDPDKRARYDQYGEHWKNAGGFGGFGANGTGGASGGFEGFDFSQFGGGGGFSSFFEELFGGGRKTRSQGGFGGFGGFGNGFGRNAQPATPAEQTYNVSIDLYTALLGGEIIVQTPEEKLKLKVKPGTQPGSKVRLKGKGPAQPDGSRGNLIIQYQVRLPEHLNERQQELLRQMQRA